MGRNYGSTRRGFPDIPTLSSGGVYRELYLYDVKGEMMTAYGDNPIPFMGNKKKLLLKSCPFCGSGAQIEYWHGGKKTKRMVSCSNPYCSVGPQVCGETPQKAIEKWNQRLGEIADRGER